MNQLIPLHSQTIDGNAIETVSARELHSWKVNETSLLGLRTVLRNTSLWKIKIMSRFTKKWREKVNDLR